MLPQEIIRKKRNVRSCPTTKSLFIVKASSMKPERGQVASFAMSVFFRGMTVDERVALTLGLTRSGIQLDWSDLDLPGPVIDKHSSVGSAKGEPDAGADRGGVRRLRAHISARARPYRRTLDKLSAISGYETQPDLATFRKVVREGGCAIIGQTDELAPADGGSMRGATSPAASNRSR